MNSDDLLAMGTNAENAAPMATQDEPFCIDWASFGQAMALPQIVHDDDPRASAVVAPLQIAKLPVDTPLQEQACFISAPATTSILSRSPSLRSRTQISPPLTPKRSREVLPGPVDAVEQEEPTFHSYLRAFHHFQPSSTVMSAGDESSITIPIDLGDVILVHSIHPNGWADGTLLASGARGWLPTNYCEPYDHPSIRALLNALTQLWDLVRNAEHENIMAFARSDYVRAMIAGVRIFLVCCETGIG